MKKAVFFILLIVVALAFFLNKNLFFKNVDFANKSFSDYSVSDTISKIPAGINAWVVNDIDSSRKMLNQNGIANWNSLDKIVRIYFSVKEAAVLDLGLKIKAPDGNSKISIGFDDQIRQIALTNKEFEDLLFGTFSVEPGYHYVEIQGLEKDGATVAEISELLVAGISPKMLAYVPIENPYFGKRGPSVHMNYTAPLQKDIVYFYNEVTVPEGEDVVGSFFMANGHAQGYFGMQVNSETERRILFSIWSAYTTDNPDEIPDDYKVTNLGNGADVTVQDFGNEGSGKQSFKVFDWKAGTTYKFLLKGEPSVNNSTDYTAYFYAPEVGEWQIIASLRRPKTSTYLTRLHSFLENFYPSTGFISREVNFGNQWVYTTANKWHEVTQGVFTADATAMNGDRLDFTGGVSGNNFFLKNCGFFNSETKPRSTFSRVGSGIVPEINLSALEKLKITK